MNFSTQETEIIQETLDAALQDIKQLNELEMVLVGGGCGEVIFG